MKINGHIYLYWSIDTKSIYSYVFIVKLYNIGNNIGFLQSNIEFIRSHTDFKDEFIS